jgi:hypothetical protein
MSFSTFSILACTPIEGECRLAYHLNRMKRKKPKSRVNDDASYVCDACGEEIVIPIDLSAGESQEYVEDCPVCCRPNLIHVEIDEGGDVRVWAEAE